MPSPACSSGPAADALGAASAGTGAAAETTRVASVGASAAVDLVPLGAQATVEGAQIVERCRAQRDLVDQVGIGFAGPPLRQHDLVVHGLGISAEEDRAGVLLGHGHAQEVAVERRHPLQVA